MIRESKKPAPHHQQYELHPYRPSNAATGMASSHKLTTSNSPKYSFGRSTREEQPKRYVTKQMAKTENFGKQTSMGYYTPKEAVTSNRSPSWKIIPKAKLKTQPHYEYYNQDNQLNLQAALATTRPKSGRVSFGNEQRFKDDYNSAPGPEYYPQAQVKTKQPQYSIGFRRAVKGFDPFQPLESSNQKVGPGTYRPQKSPLTATHHNSPKWSIPRSPKKMKTSVTSMHQTYDVSGSMGAQKLSSKKSAPKLTINKTNRESKGLIMKAHMQFRPMQVRIAHPSF